MSRGPASRNGLRRVAVATVDRVLVEIGEDSAFRIQDDPKRAGDIHQAGGLDRWLHSRSDVGERDSRLATGGRRVDPIPAIADERAPLTRWGDRRRLEVRGDSRLDSRVRVDAQNALVDEPATQSSPVGEPAIEIGPGRRGASWIRFTISPDFALSRTTAGERPEGAPRPIPPVRERARSAYRRGAPFGDDFDEGASIARPSPWRTRHPNGGAAHDDRPGINDPNHVQMRPSADRSRPARRLKGDDRKQPPFVRVAVRGSACMRQQRDDQDTTSMSLSRSRLRRSRCAPAPYAGSARIHRAALGAVGEVQRGTECANVFGDDREAQSDRLSRAASPTMKRPVS